MLEAHLILTIRLYSLTVAVNMVEFWFCFWFPPILLNKLVLCRHCVIIIGLCCNLGGGQDLGKQESKAISAHSPEPGCLKEDTVGGWVGGYLSPPGYRTGMAQEALQIRLNPR